MFRQLSLLGLLLSAWGCAGGTAALQEAEPGTVRIQAVVLERPPFELTTSSKARPTTAPPKLSVRKATKNQITDDDEWLAENGFSLLETGAHRDAPPAIQGTPLWRVIPSGEMDLYLYRNEGPGQFVLGLPQGSDDFAPAFAFDFSSYVLPPRAAEDAEEFVAMELNWAEFRDGVLYVNHAHRTYASSSFGTNAFITAIAGSTGELLWRSQPLVANAKNFLVYEGYLVCGYGFTSEPDFLYVLDRATGAALGTTKIKSGPTYLFREGRVLFVRSYDTDYEFELR